VQDYCNEHNLQSKVELKQPKRERKQRTTTVKERASDTKNISFQMFKDGKSIAEIAEERKLSLITIENHISYYVGNGELPIADLVKFHKQQAIEKAAELFGTTSLKALKENLPEEISYGEIKMVLAAMQGNS
jgi:ATP-dependent DNA helicase RecQ